MITNPSLLEHAWALIGLDGASVGRLPELRDNRNRSRALDAESRHRSGPSAGTAREPGRLARGQKHLQKRLGVVVVLVCGIAVGYATALTYFWNRTASVVPCILLHASFNTANGMAGLQTEAELVAEAYAIITVCLTGTLAMLMLLLAYRTRGGLGLGKAPAARRPKTTAPQSGPS